MRLLSSGAQGGGVMRSLGFVAYICSDGGGGQGRVMKTAGWGGGGGGGG